MVRSNAAQCAGKPPPYSPPQYHWLCVMCLIGVDYFSSLAYQPSITYEVAGPLGPLATVAVILVTLFGALPAYLYIAGRSPHGQGSVALLEKLVHGWRGKAIVLLLLGFAATDFVMIKTISLADAAEHMVGNNFRPWQDSLDSLALVNNSFLQYSLGDSWRGYCNKQTVITVLLGALCFVFWALMRKGFNRKAITLAVWTTGIYMFLNAVVIGSGVLYLVGHPDLVNAWWQQVLHGHWPTRGESWGIPPGWMLALVSALYLPQLALGLSGFEMSAIVMPQVRGAETDDPACPSGRIRNTRKALVLAALIMSVYLMGSILVTNILIPADAFGSGGLAHNRALAYLAHGGALVDGSGAVQANPLFGEVFGSIYDASTVIILCLAGMSVITALQTLLPQFLLRLGMQLHWVHRWGMLFLMFALINLGVTLWFHASVTDQRGAYATAVLVLMSDAAIVTAIDRRRRARPGRLWRIPWLFGPLALIFLLMTFAVVAMNPSGLVIAAGFILTIFVSSVFSRAVRVGELRTIGFEFLNEGSKILWDRLKHLDFPVLIPHRPGRTERDWKEEAMRREHQLSADVEIVFMEVDLEDPSNFFQDLLVEVVQEGRRYVIKVTRCVSVAHAIAAVALEMSRLSKPPTLHFGWTEKSLLEASWGYIVSGEGNVPWKVRELIDRQEPDPDRRPRVVVG